MSTSPSTSSNRKKPFIIHKQAREMARNVLQICIEEKKDNNLAYSLNNALDRAARYTGLTKRTLTRIQTESKIGSLRSPSKKGKMCKKKTNLNVDDFDRSVIYRCIEEFYLTKKVVPTCPKLLAAIREKIDFPWGVTSIRKLLKAMGYKWQKCHNKRKILVEKPAVVFARTNYLRKIRQFRENDRNIFFLGETWIDNNLTFKKCWRNDYIDAVLTDTSSTNRLILVHAGSRHGFLDGAKLLFKAGTATGDYHGQMNSTNFEKWVTNMFIPNLPQASVVVMDNAPYHNVQENKVPTKSSTKTVMLDWLSRNNVEASLSMRKVELFELIKLHAPQEKTFKIDQLIRSHGHEVLRLPPYMCDLNSIELAWAKVKRDVREHNVNSDLSLKRLKEVTEMAINQVTEEDWSGYDDHVISLEEHYWQKDVSIENAIDKFIIEVSDGEDSDSDSALSVIFASDSD
ncbi:unnamed protein product [Euphydryas editha]|uniref:Tc1-like transposase DDE domain-containing protein n=1 Tax=Euphydryas editha TaxID=104508 RepID=A0AAU9UFL5_EUPED|nr:unnamed protein product [Euphydryas editha]